MAKKKESNIKANNEGHGKIENEQTVAILSYLLIGIIWFFVDEKVRKSSFAKFHVKQALNLLIISLAISIIFNILHVLLIIPLFGAVFNVVLSVIRFVIGVILFVLWLIGIISAASNKSKELPIIGHFAGKYLTF
ncbi:MAG: DUF4870 domain-containing protein [Candidatus Woesearchaeota archaeon]